MTLLAFLVLLLLALVVFARVETQVARNQQLQVQAQQNALLGLTLAVGQLQRYAGPDQRATARAAFLPAAQPNKTQWSGVWGDPSVSPVWVVSTPPGVSADPTSAFVNPVILVGTNTGEVTGTATNDSDQVRVDTVDLTVPAVEYPGWDGSADPVVGRYAYWVGEEASKPSLVMRDERSILVGGSGPNP